MLPAHEIRNKASLPIPEFMISWFSICGNWCNSCLAFRTPQLAMALAVRAAKKFLFF